MCCKTPSKDRLDKSDQNVNFLVEVDDVPTSKKSTEKTNKDYFVKLNLFKSVQLLPEEVMFLSFALLEQETFPNDLLLKAPFLFTIYSGSSCTERCPGDLRGFLDALASLDFKL